MRESERERERVRAFFPSLLHPVLFFLSSLVHLVPKVTTRDKFGARERHSKGRGGLVSEQDVTTETQIPGAELPGMV